MIWLSVRDMITPYKCNHCASIPSSNPTYSSYWSLC